MSFTDFYFEREEKKALEHSKALMQDEFDGKENFKKLYDALQDCKNIFEISLEDEDTSASLNAYGAEFISDMYELLKKLKEFESKYQKLY